MKEGEFEKLPKVTLKRLDATRKDARAIFYLLTDQGNPTHFANYGNLAPDANLTVDKVMKLFEDQPEMKAWGIEYGRRLVGAVSIQPTGDLKSVEGSSGLRAGEIGCLVSKKYAGRGIGKAAVQSLLANESKSYDVFLAFVHRDNKASEKVFLANGFKERKVIYPEMITFEWTASGAQVLPDVTDVNATEV